MSVGIQKSTAKRFPLLTPQEGLVLDLQVVLADFSNLENLLSSIVNSLQELQQYQQVQGLQDCLQEGS